MSLERRSPKDLVEKAVADLQDLADAKDLRLRGDVESGLPEVSVEPQQILHVFSNLVSNAIKYSPAGEEVLVQARHDGEGAVRFSVTDRGPGVPLQYQSRMFDKFFRVPGSKSVGAGLGLAISREIVTAHDGHVGLNSHAGKGSEFYFVLPATGETSDSRKREARKI